MKSIELYDGCPGGHGSSQGLKCPACTTTIPFATKTIADAELLTYQRMKLTDLHGVQNLERKTLELQAENERLKRISSLHMRRCLMLEDICYKNGLHVPGGLVVHHEQ